MTTVATASDEWSTYQHDTRNTGFNPIGTGPASEPTVAWRGVSEHTDGPATVVDGVVYVGGPEKVYAYDVETGEEQWTYEVGDMVDAAVTVAGETVVFPSRAGKVHALSAADGSAYLGAQSGFVYAVDLDTAEVLWAAGPEAANSIFGSPAVVDETVYATNHAQGSEIKPVLSALDAASGDIRWSYDLGPETHGSRSVGSVCVAHDAVFASNRNGVLHAVERTDGTERWTFDTGRRIYGAASVDTDRVYVGNDGGTVYALDPDTGEVHWQFSDSSVHAVDAAPTPVNGALYVTSDDRSLVALTES